MNKKTFWLSFTPYIIVILLIILFFYKVVLFNQYFYWRDIFAHSYPAKKLFVDAIRSGVFPLWNPYIQTGIPYLADLSNQPLYIFNLIFLFLPPNFAMNTVIILHYCICAVFTYLFVRDLTDNKYIGIFSAITFALCGYCVSVSCNLEYLSPIPWIPAALWAFYKAQTTNRQGYLFLTAIFLSLILFAGDPMAFYFLVGFLFLRCIFEIKDRTAFKSFLRSFFIVTIVSIAIAAVQILPSMELSALSVRSAGFTFAEATIWSFHPLRLFEFLFPSFYGHHFPFPAYWGVFMNDYAFTDLPWAEGIYIGTIPIILALVSFYYHRNKEKFFWLAVVIISLLLAFGCHTPVYKLLFNTLPLFSVFRYPEKIILFTSFALIILAALSLKDLSENKATLSPKTRYFIIVFLIIACSIITFNFSSLFALKDMSTSGAVTATFINANFDFRILYFTLTTFVFLFSWYLLSKKPDYSKQFLIFIIIICFLDIFYINSTSFVTSKIDFFKQSIKIADYIKKDWKQNYPPRLYATITPSFMLSKPYLADTSAKMPQKDFLNDFYGVIFDYYLKNLKPNRSLIYKIGTILTVSPLQIKKVKDVLNYYEKQDKIGMINRFNVNYALEIPDLTSIYLNDPGVKVTIPSEAFNESFLKMTDISPRAFMAYNVSFYTNDKAIQNEFFSKSFNIRQQVLLRGGNTEEWVNNKTDVVNKVEITHYDFNKVNISVDSKSAGYLVLMDSVYPGWKVFVDNKPAKLLTADYIYRSVKLPSGKHKVTFVFDPLIVKIGLIITLTTILIGLIYFQFFVNIVNIFQMIRSIKTSV